MTKLNAALFSLKATGRLGGLFALAKRRGRNIIERRPIPTDAKSPAQLFSRHMFTKCVDLWHLLSEAEQLEWESLARPRHMTGYAWYISQCLRPNPGIYLPLQGGIMSGNIDMDSNRLLKLPAPTHDQESATKKYVDDLAPGLHAATHQNGAADEINLAALSGLLADDQHIIDAEVLAIAEAIGVAAALMAAHEDLDTGVHGAGDSVLATTLNIAAHAAIAAAHHARYTDGEAITAAKTVKLDDFATPDDNADLNASISRHGLLRKLSNVAAQFLNGVGNWVEVAGEAATKEFFVPATVTLSGAWATLNHYPIMRLTGVNHKAFMSFFVPADFSSITAAVVMVIPRATDATADWDIYAGYAASGQPYSAHDENDTVSTYNVTNFQLFEVDVSGILSALAAGDYVGIEFVLPTGSPDVEVVGVRFKYS